MNSAVTVKPAARPAATIVRMFHAPLATVWAAWTDPDRLGAWWGPHRVTTTGVTGVSQAGSEVRIDMVDTDSRKPVAMVLTFHEITPPGRLVFTTRMAGAVDGPQAVPLLTTVTMTEDRGRTTVVILSEVTGETPFATIALQGFELGLGESLERLGGQLHSLVLAIPDAEPIVEISRIFDAPRSVLWEALTKAEHLRHWWGQRSATNVVCEIDARPGGSWRIHQRVDTMSMGGAPAGTVFKFKGRIIDVVRPERIVQTFEMEEMFEDKVIVETLTLAELGPARTLYRVVSHFESPGAMAFEDRAGMIASGMSYGAQETYDRLADYLVGLQP